MNTGFLVFLVMSVILTVSLLFISVKKVNFGHKVPLYSSVLGLALIAYTAAEAGFTQFTIALGIFFFLAGAISVVKLIAVRLGRQIAN